MPSTLFRGSDGRSLLFTFLLVSSLFLLWGFCNGMIDVMDKHFQEQLQLSKAQSAWVQFAHYLGYFLMAIPAGALATKLGYKTGIVVGLLIVSAGGFWFLPATWIGSMAQSGSVSPAMAFVAFLGGVCVIATGLTFLETVANPYTTVLGDPRYAATRINLAQSCNGVGWLLGPIAGGAFFYSRDAAGKSSGSETLYIPYVGVAVIVLILAVIFWFAKLPDIAPPDEYVTAGAEAGGVSVWAHPHFVFGVAAQFFYVAAQAGIFSFFINYMTSELPPISAGAQAALQNAGQHMGALSGWLSGWVEHNQLTDKGAANLASAGFLLFLIGRLGGARLLKKFPAAAVLGVCALANTVLCLAVFAHWGWASAACVFLTYLFMSIMFPTIFALGISGLGLRTKKASAYLVMAIMGGAVVPKLMGYVADRFDMSRGFIVPAACFLVVAAYGFSWPRLTRRSVSAAA